MSILEDWQPARELMARMDSLIADCDDGMRSHPTKFARDHYRSLGATLAVVAASLAKAIEDSGEDFLARLATLESGAMKLETSKSLTVPDARLPV